MHEESGGMTCPFLVHQSLIGTIVYHFFAKNRRSEFPIDLFGIQVSVFAVENEVIALLAEKHSGGLAEQDKGEAVSMLGLAIKEELVRIDAILNRAADKGENVEDDRRSVGICEE